jgi:hypothetical protein
VRLPICDGGGVVLDHRFQAADRSQSTRDREVYLLRDSLHSRAQEYPRRHLARSFRGAFRRSNGTAS